MGDSISKMHDEHEDYERLCLKLGLKPFDVYDFRWMDHEKEIMIMLNPKKREDHTLGEN